jgi:hypothetical protein
MVYSCVEYRIHLPVSVRKMWPVRSVEYEHTGSLAGRHKRAYVTFLDGTGVKHSLHVLSSESCCIGGQHRPRTTSAVWSQLANG